MPQPLNLTGGGSGTLLVHRQMRTLLPGRPGGVVLEIEQILCVPGQRSRPGVEVRALGVRTWPQGATAIWGSPDSKSGEAQ
jgi:hypothetical protein